MGEELFHESHSLAFLAGAQLSTATFVGSICGTLVFVASSSALLEVHSASADSLFQPAQEYAASPVGPLG